MNLYEKSAGRNAFLLLNVPPNRDGRIDDADVASCPWPRRSRPPRYG
ncbi:hypothetical protein OH735_10005 [Streptomyces sp. NBC_01618]|nr:hypothetical protein OH735_10005 [Streptomyces sp. NBC_01618]